MKATQFLWLQCTWSFWCSWPVQVQLATDFWLCPNALELPNQPTAHCRHRPADHSSFPFLSLKWEVCSDFKRKHQIQIQGWGGNVKQGPFEALGSKMCQTSDPSKDPKMISNGLPKRLPKWTLKEADRVFKSPPSNLPQLTLAYFFLGNWKPVGFSWVVWFSCDASDCCDTLALDWMRIKIRHWNRGGIVAAFNND